MPEGRGRCIGAAQDVYKRQGQGVTLCAKNWYGVTDIDRNFRKNQHNNFNQDRGGRPRYMTFTDYIAHKDLGQKTMLFLIDGLYGSEKVNGAPS